MALQVINTGTAANSGDGDNLRAAMTKAKENFSELYSKPDLTLSSDTLTLTKADGSTDTVSLAAYLDEDSRSIASGVLDSATGIVTFTRDDATTFTLDLSGLLDDTNTFRTVTAGGNTLGSTETLAFTAGSGITISESGGAVTISSSGGVSLAGGANDRVVTASGASSLQAESEFVFDGTNVGIGTSSPSRQLTVENDPGNAIIAITSAVNSSSYLLMGDTTEDNTGMIVYNNSTNEMDFYANSNSAAKMRLESDGDLHVDGDVIAASTTVSSDEKLKDNIKEIFAPLETIKTIRGVDFNWKKDGSKSSGVIAQDIQKAMPHLVKEVKSMDSDESHLTVDYNGLIGLLIESIKSLSNEVEQLKSK